MGKLMFILGKWRVRMISLAQQIPQLSKVEPQECKQCHDAHAIHKTRQCRRFLLPHPEPSVVGHLLLLHCSPFKSSSRCSYPKHVSPTIFRSFIPNRAIYSKPPSAPFLACSQKPLKSNVKAETASTVILITCAYFYGSQLFARGKTCRHNDCRGLIAVT